MKKLKGLLKQKGELSKERKLKLEFGLGRFPLKAEGHIFTRFESLTSVLVPSFLVIKAIIDILPSPHAVSV